MTVSLIYVGHDGQRVVDSVTTQRQIDELRALPCALLDPESGAALTWDDVDTPAEPRTLFQMILHDRRGRVDRRTLMADRPPSAVATVVDGVAVRLEFYEGHDALEKTYDVRSAELQGKQLPDWLVCDPLAYRPTEFLREAFGFDPEWTRPLLERLHQKPPAD